MRPLLSRALAVLALAALATAARSAPVLLSVQPESKLWIDGVTAVRNFTCEAGRIDATIEAKDAKAVAEVLAAKKAVRRAEVRVPTAELECNNAIMNEHMLKSLLAEQHPTVSYRLDSYGLARRAGEPVSVRLAGRLAMGGTERPVAMEALAEPGPEGSLKLTGKHDLLMSDYGLQAPVVMFGRLKVEDAITIRYELYLKP